MGRPVEPVPSRPQRVGQAEGRWQGVTATLEHLPTSISKPFEGSDADEPHDDNRGGIQGVSVSVSVSGVKGHHFALSTPAADDTNSRFDNILPGLGLNRAAPLDQESPGSIPGGATPPRGRKSTTCGLAVFRERRRPGSIPAQSGSRTQWHAANLPPSHREVRCAVRTRFLQRKGYTSLDAPRTHRGPSWSD